MAKDFALIPAAGDFKSHSPFHKPKGLLSLGKESIIERLLRQLKEANIIPIIATGVGGEGHWKEEHTKSFKRLPCEVLLSPATATRYPTLSLCFLLERLLNNAAEYELEASSKIYVIPCDWVFSQGVFQEMLGYQVPCTIFYKSTDATIVFTGLILPKVLELLRGCQYITVLGRYACQDLGFKLENHDYCPGRFVEVDFFYEYKWAIQLAANEIQPFRKHKEET